MGTCSLDIHYYPTMMWNDVVSAYPYGKGAWRCVCMYGW